MESARYGMPSGQPQARFSTQTPQYNVAEAPACVQNAMMTKDKKPFTYTPGGIDLSQIKSQRMAKRLARNAQNEGTTGQQQMNRPNQSPQESSNAGKAQVGSVLGATAMGMPFQVFPTGPPPPPPPPTTKNGAPPPPPPVPKNNLDSISKANTTRGSSVPKNFEPPPLGFRPEIKIPPNPMAALKKVPTPHEKNNFWIEEYRKEHSKSPMRETNNFNAQSQDQHQENYNERPNDAIQNQRYQDTEFNQQAMKKQSQPNVNKENQITVQLAPINRNQNTQQQQQYAETPRSPQYAQQERPTSPQNHQSVPWQHVETPRSPQYRPLEHQISQTNTLQQQVETPRSPQYRPLERQISQKNTLPQQVETPRSPQYQYQPQKEQQLPQKDHQSIPWQHVETPVSPATPQYISVAPQFIPQEQPTSQKNIQSVPWRTNKHVTPNTDNDFSNKSEVKSSSKPETNQFVIQNQEQKYPGYGESRDGLNVNKKNIEPQFSKSQIPQRQISINRGDGPSDHWSNVPKSSDHMNSPPVPHVFNNGALKKMNEGLRLESISNNPYAKEVIIPIQLEQTPPTSRDQQFNYSKPLLQSGNSNGQSTPSRSTFSPNQFVDQGYNDFSAQPAPITFNKTNNTSNVNTHIIPMAIESNNGGHTVVIQRDPRMKNTSGGECSTPTQSKSFKVLQQITDTSNESGPEIRAVDSEGSDLDTKLHRPTYARQMTTQHVNANSPIILHNNTQIENMYNTPGNSPGTKISHRPFVIQRPVLNSNEQFQHFVRPNATQMAIPNLNFKMLEAMTTAENAAENENSKVIESNNLINEYENDCAYPCLYPHGIPPCCHPSNASNHVYANNLQYISPPYQPLLIQQEQYHHPHHPHSQHQAHHHHSLHHYQYHPCPCCCYYMHSEHGSKNVGCFFRERDRIARSQEPPNVIVTSSSDDFATKINENNVRQKRSLSVDDTYSRRVSGNSKMTVTELNRERDNDICCGTLKRFCPQNNLAGDESRTSLDTTFENDLTSPSPSSSDNSTTSSFEDCAEQLQIGDGALQAVKSVANIQVYNLEDAEDDDRTIDDGESMVFDEEEEEEEEEEEDEMLEDKEVEYEEEDLYLDYTNSEGEEQEIYEEDADLSVIYEENEADLASQRPTSSNSYCMSESSTLEQSKSSKGEEILLPDEDIEDNSNSVTVRLPLRFSFSRSINDESVATIEVGNSQIDDKDKSLSMGDIEPNSEQCNDTDPYDCDVSVTISLSHCSGSEESNATLSSPVASKFDNENMMKKCIWDSDEEDVSVSVTLPSRNHSFDQSKNISVTLSSTSLIRHDEIMEVTLPSELREENAVEDEDIDFWATLSSGEADKTNYAESSLHNKFEVVKEASHTSAAKDENIVEEEEDFWATISSLKSNKTHNEETVAESSSHKEEVKEVSYLTDAKDEVVEEEDFWATISSKDTHTNSKTEAVLESSSHSKDVDVKEVSYTSDTKDENIVEEEEEEDFWATISSIKSNKTRDDEAVLEIIPHNNQDEIEEASKSKDVEIVDEELDFWATLQATRSEAKLFLQKTAGFWGTSSLDANKKNESQPTAIHVPETSVETLPITILEPVKNIPIEPTNIHEPKEIAPTENREGNSLEPEVKKTVKPKKKITTSENSTTKVKKKKLKQPENSPSDKEMINEKVNVTPQKIAEKLPTEESSTNEKPCNGKMVEVETKSKITKIESITEQKIDGNMNSFIKKENLRSKLVSEIAELKALVMERKFFQSLLIPEKPVPIQAVLSTLECESVTTTEIIKVDKKIIEEISHNTSTKIAETSLEKPNEVEVQKPKKKVIKSKVTEQDKSKPKIKKTLRTATSTKQEDGEEKQKSAKILNSTNSSENIELKIEKGKQSSLAEENNTQDHNITDCRVEDKAPLASEFKSPIAKKSSKDEEKKAIQTESKPIQGPEISKAATAGKSKTKTEKKTALDAESKPVQGDVISKALKTEDSIARKSSITENKTSLYADSQSPQGPEVSKSTIGKKSAKTEEKMAIPTESKPVQISEIYKAPTSAKSSKTDEKISIPTASKPIQVSKVSIAPITIDSSKNEEKIAFPIVSTPAQVSEIFKAPTARKSSKTEENIPLVTENIPVQVSEIFKAPIAKKSSKTEKKTALLSEISPIGALKDPIVKISSGTKEIIGMGSATDQPSEVSMALNLRKSSKTEESIGMDDKSVKTSEISKPAAAKKSSKTEESTGNKPVKVKKSSKLSLQNQKSNIPNDMVSGIGTQSKNGIGTQSKNKIESQDSEEFLKPKDHYNALKDQLVTFSWSTIDGFNSQYAVTSDVRIEGPLNGCIDYWREKRSPSPTYNNPNQTNDESEGIDIRLENKSSDSGTRKAISSEDESKKSSKSTSDPQSSKKKDSTLIKDLEKIKKFAKKIKSESENSNLGDISTENDGLFKNKSRSGSVSENVITKTLPVEPNPLKKQPRSLASSCNFHLYNDNDVQFLYFNSQPSYFPVQNEPPRVPMIGTVDFWSVQEKFEPNSEIYMNNAPIEERKCYEPETDFWAEIKGTNTDECEEFVPLSKSESEVCRNNFKKAAAFFTNTISATKKDEYVAKPKVPVPRVQKNEEVIAIPSSDESKQDKLPFRSYVSIETDNVQDHKTTKNTFENVKPIEKCQQLETREDPVTEMKLVSSENITLTVPNQCRPKVFSKQNIASTEQTSCDSIPTETKTSVKDRISAFESGAIEQPVESTNASLVIESPTPVSSLSRNSSQRSESEVEEDDSGVLDMNKPLSETDTESECFPELRKMTRYQRASTHSRLFKLLQDADDVIEEEKTCDDDILEAEFNFRKPKKIVHNVSITRRQNPQALQQAETLIQRRQRLSLPLQRNSIDADNPSSPNSPASPMYDQQASHVSDKLVNELVQSLLLKKSSISLKNLPMEKLQAAAKRVLEEELDSLDNTSLDSTPALTPQDPRNPSYADYYDTWKTKNDPENSGNNNNNFEILPSRAFKVLQESTATAKRKPWAVLCPRVHSSKTVNSDLSRVTESPESSYRSSPEITSQRAGSIGPGQSDL